MSTKANGKQGERNGPSSLGPDAPHPGGLFHDEEFEGDRPLTPPDPAGDHAATPSETTIGSRDSSGDRAPQAPVDPSPDPEGFDLDSIIEAKREGGWQQSSPDPFDPARLRLSQNFAAATGGRKVITTIPVRKPSREWFVRTHPDESYRLPTAVLELKEDREVYLVMPELWPDLSSEATFSPRLLIASISRNGIPFLWPIRLPGADGKIDSWSQSAMDAADLARTEWVRTSANMGLQAYDVIVATVKLAEPVWPDLPFGEMLRIGFRGKTIDSLDHPVLRKLRGEA